MPSKSEEYSGPESPSCRLPTCPCRRRRHGRLQSGRRRHRVRTLVVFDHQTYRESHRNRVEAREIGVATHLHSSLERPQLGTVLRIVGPPSMQSAVLLKATSCPIGPTVVTLEKSHAVRGSMSVPSDQLSLSKPLDTDWSANRGLFPHDFKGVVPVVSVAKVGKAVSAR